MVSYSVGQTHVFLLYGAGKKGGGKREIRVKKLCVEHAGWEMWPIPGEQPCPRLTFDGTLSTGVRVRGLPSMSAGSGWP